MREVALIVQNFSLFRSILCHLVECICRPMSCLHHSLTSSSHSIAGLPLFDVSFNIPNTVVLISLLSFILHVSKHVQLPFDSCLHYVLLKLQSHSNPFVCYLLLNMRRTISFHMQKPLHHVWFLYCPWLADIYIHQRRLPVVLTVLCWSWICWLLCFSKWYRIQSSLHAISLCAVLSLHCSYLYCPTWSGCRSSIQIVPHYVFVFRLLRELLC